MKTLVSVLLGAASIGALTCSQTAWAQESVADPALDAEQPIPSGADSGVAAAQSGRRAQAGDGEAVIVVTAQRRSENVQDVPISISAFSGSTLENANVTTVQDLPRLAPNLRTDNPYQAAKTRISIRGVGSSGGTAVEPSVATFSDGIYVPREGATVGAYLDLEGVEVLRGPQGTLFGRNASAGAILLRSARPTQDFSGQLTAEYGTGNRRHLEGFVNVPVSDGVAFRLAAMGELFDGLYHNRLDGRTVGGVDSFAGRITGSFELASNFHMTIRANHARRDGVGWAPFSLVPSSFPPGRLDVFLARYAALGETDYDLDIFDRRVNEVVLGDMNDRQWGVSSEITLDTASGFSLRLLNGYIDWRNDQSNDAAFTATFETFQQTLDWGSESHSHELQLISPQDQLLGGHLDFVAGLYYMHESYSRFEAFRFKTGACNLALVSAGAAVYNACLAGAASDAASSDYNQTTDSLAGYAQATIRIAPIFDVVLGGRWTHESKDATYLGITYSLAGNLVSANENSVYSLSDSQFTWRANANFRPSEDVLMYLSYSTGYKSGGFNDQLSPTVLGTRRVFNPETIDNYELGIRTELIDRTLTANMTIYRMDINNFQDRSYNGINYTLQNAGAIRNQGVELELVARPTRGLRVNTSIAYLDAKFTNYPGASNLPGLPGTRDITGERPAFAPEWTGSVGAQYESRVPGTSLAILARADLAFVSSANIGTINDANPQFIQNGYELMSARLTLYGPDRRWSVSAFGDNLTSAHYCGSLSYAAFVGLLGGVLNGQSALRCLTVGTPRTMGVAASFNF